MPNQQTAAPPSPSAISLKSDKSTCFEHGVIYLPTGQPVLAKHSDPNKTALLPQAADYEISKSAATGVETVSSLSLGTMVTAS